MSDLSERRVGPLTVRIDRTLCVGFGDCVTAEPGAFVLDEEDLATFGPAVERLERAALLAAAAACPVDAIEVWDETGRRLVP